MSSKTKEHVYIVFAKDINIEDGIAQIEQAVLGGRTLEVSRKDVKGNAVVAIITADERADVKKLDIVSRIKVEMPAVKLRGGGRTAGQSLS